MRQIVPLTSLAFLLSLAPSAIADVEDMSDLFRVETILEKGHPCEKWGGVWRGWCMDMKTIQTVGKSEQLLQKSEQRIMDRTQKQGMVRTGQAYTSHRNLRALLRKEPYMDFRCIGIPDFSERRACHREQRKEWYAVR